MNKIIVLTESLVGNAYEALVKIISHEANKRFLFFRFAEERAIAAGVYDNYKAVIKLLDEKNLPYDFLNEDGLDEYFFSHKKSEEELYIAPTEAVSQVIASISMLDYKGVVYLCGCSPDEPPVQNARPFVNALKRNSAGTKGLDTTSSSFSHIVGSNCYFNLNGKEYVEKIKGRDSVINQGQEGYTQICESNQRLRLKIWDRDKRAFEIDKVLKMTALPDKCNSIALPLAMVYNEHNNPIGFVMYNFVGEPLRIDKLRFLDNPLIYVKQILEQLLWMEAHGLLHRDLNHNIIVNTKSHTAHVIDTDSIQFRQLPAMAQTEESDNALPLMYTRFNAFYNTVDLSYTGLSILAAAFVDTGELFCVWNKNSGFCDLDETVFSELSVKAPEVAKLIKAAHTSGLPVSLARQLSVVNQMLCTKGKTKINELPSSDDKAAAASNADDCFHSYEYADVDGTDGNDIDCDDDDYCCNYTDTTSDFVDDYQSSHKYKSADEEGSQQNADVDVGKLNISKVKGSQNDYSLKLALWIKHLIINAFMTNTKPVGVTDEELWQQFISSGLWKKPLLATATTILVIVILLIAISIL